MSIKRSAAISLVALMAALAPAFAACAQVSAATVAATAQTAEATTPLVAQSPTLSATQVAFTMGGEIWLAGRDGGAAHRITTGAGAPTRGGNAFSPDGRTLAYTATYGGDEDVYVLDLAGGAPRRLTFDAKADQVVGWTQDGKVLFRSTRNTYYKGYGLPRLYTVGLDGGRPEALPFPIGYSVALAPDGVTAALEPQQLINISWKQYRGGDQRRILIVDRKTLAQQDLPGPSANDFDPMWVDETLYFVSDRDGRQSLYAYDKASQTIHRLFDPGERDVLSASLGPGAIIFTQIDGLSLFDLASQQVRRLTLKPIGDRPGGAPYVVDLKQRVVDAAVSDDGAVAFEAHGRTVLYNPAGVPTVYGASDHAERVPAFAGASSFSVQSDVSGTNVIEVRDLQTGKASRSVTFDSLLYLQGVAWSRDGASGAFVDGLRNIWIATRGAPPRQIDRNLKTGPWNDWDAAWSPDGKQVAYSRNGENGLYGVFVWSATDNRVRRVTPQTMDARQPSWEADGKRLWFTASVTTPPGHAYLDMSDKVRPPSLKAIMAVRAEGASWSQPNRLDLPQKRYEGVYATPAAGKLLVVETNVPPEGARLGHPMTQTVLAVDADADTVTASKLVEGVESLNYGELMGRLQTSLRVSPSGAWILYRKDGEWSAASVADGALAKSRPLSFAQAIVTAQPREEWRQMFEESFRLLSYFFHDSVNAPRDFQAMRRRYVDLVPALASRQDLTWLLEDVEGELHLSHADVSSPPPASSVTARPATGTLGVDVAAEGMRYRITRIYHADLLTLGEPAPLDAAVTLAAKAGDYIDSIDGRSVTADRDLAEYLQERAGRPTRLCLSGADPKVTRCARVTPIGDDAGLRAAAWRDANQRAVEDASGGKLGYIHLPDTVETGIEAFNQARYAQNDKLGFVVDARFNNGGYAADYLVSALTAPILSRWRLPGERDLTTPGIAMRGPKAMLINAYCGSGCDTYAWYFKHLNIGPVIGTPTWGGVSGSGLVPPLLDGAVFTVPAYSFADPDGRPALEGHAVEPTLPMVFDLRAMADGRDPQLDAAIGEVLKRLPEGQ